MSFQNTDICAEAQLQPKRQLVVDLLTGGIPGTRYRDSLLQSVLSYRDGLSELSACHGLDPSHFKKLRARFDHARAHRPRFAVIVGLHDGRSVVDLYAAGHGERLPIASLRVV